MGGGAGLSIGRMPAAGSAGCADRAPASRASTTGRSAARRRLPGPAARACEVNCWSFMLPPPLEVGSGDAFAAPAETSRSIRGLAIRSRSRPLDVLHGVRQRRVVRRREAGVAAPELRVDL